MALDPSLGLEFTVYADGLSVLFALLITGIGSLVILYSIFYLSKTKEAIHHFYVYLLMFMGAMLGVVLSDNLIVLYGFWELTSISSFLLIAFWNEREKSRYGALKSMLITMFGGLAMLAGFVMLYGMTGTFSIRGIIADAAAVTGHAWFLPALILILLGAFTKSAQFPFHIWLPDAMEAPTPVSAYLHSATMVKAGIYLAARLTPVFGGTAEWFWLIMGFGLITLFWGSISAVKQTDLKAILAYSTVSQLGLIMSLIGIGSAALYYGYGTTSQPYVAAMTAAVFHLINHATFKGSLFMVTGIVDLETGTRDIRRLGGLASLMPITFTFAIIGAFSMAGIPPFNGFLSKEMFFSGVLNAARMDIFNMDTWGVLIPVIAWIASVFTFIYSFIFVFHTFTGKRKAEELPKVPREAPLGMLIPPAVLASLVVIFGLFPNLVSVSLIEPALASIFPQFVMPGEQFGVHITHLTADDGGAHDDRRRRDRRFAVLAIPPLAGLVRRLPKKLSLNALYDGGLRGLDRLSARVTRAYMTGSVRDYLVYIFGFMIAVVGYMLFRTDAFRYIGQGSYAEITIYDAALAAVVMAARSLRSSLVNASPSSSLQLCRLSGVPVLRAVQSTGLSADPDDRGDRVVALFLLCFYHLPKLKQEVSSRRVRIGNLLISIGVGLVVTLTALAASGARLFTDLGLLCPEQL